MRVFGRVWREIWYSHGTLYWSLRGWIAGNRIHINMV